MVYFIVNPAAGSGKTTTAIPVIEKIMKEHNIEYRFVFTNAPGDSRPVADRVSGIIDFDRAKTIVCVGGDGTVQEYIGLAVGKDIDFGIIPAGSGNDLIRSTPGEKRKFSGRSGFEDKIKFYTEKIVKGDVQSVDAVSINGENYFFNIGGTGIDIQVLKDALPLKKFFGKGSYFLSLIKNIVTYKPMEMTLTADGKIEADKFVLVAICNGSYYGGGMRIAPPAVINDGFITLCKIKKMPRLKMMAMFPKVKSGGHSKLKEVAFVDCSSVKLEFTGKKIINLDGNLSEFESPLTFEIVKNAVRFIV